LSYITWGEVRFGPFGVATRPVTYLLIGRMETGRGKYHYEASSGAKTTPNNVPSGAVSWGEAGHLVFSS